MAERVVGEDVAERDVVASDSAYIQDDTDFVDAIFNRHLAAEGAGSPVEVDSGRGAGLASSVAVGGGPVSGGASGSDSLALGLPSDVAAKAIKPSSKPSGQVAGKEAPLPSGGVAEGQPVSVPAGGATSGEDKGIPQDIPSQDPKARHAFAQLRHKNSELVKKVESLQQEAAGLRQELEKYKAVSPEQNPDSLRRILEEKQQLEQRVKELEDQLGRYDLSASREFKLKYEVPLQNLTAKAKSLLVKFGVPEDQAAEQIDEVISLSMLERAEALQSLPVAVQGALLNILEDIDSLRLERDTALQNWRETKLAAEKEQEALQQAKFLEVADSLADVVIRLQEEAGNPFFMRSETDSNWNRAVEEREKTLRGLLRSGDQQALAMLIADGLTAKEFKALYEQERRARQMLEEEIQRRFSIDPRVFRRPAAAADESGQRAVQKPEVKSDEEILAELERKHFQPFLR